MRRRTLLATLAAGTTGLAGCSFATGDQSSPADETPTDAGTPTDDGTATPNDTDSKRDGPPDPPDGAASVVELETAPRTYALNPTRLHTDDEARVALWFDRTATADHPARIRGWLENGNDFENTFQLEWIPAVGRTFSRQPSGYDHEARLHLAATENHPLTDGTPDLARTDDGYWYADGGVPQVPETYRMAPGEWVELEYHLVGEEGMPGRPTGTYEFRGDDKTVSVAVWNTDRPGPEANSRFTGRSLPAFDADRTVQWFHEADQSSPAFVHPSTERLELDGLAEFEMVNHSHEGLQCGHWNLYKLVDSEWFHVAPRMHTDDCRVLAPGERKTWALRAFNGDAVPTGQGCGDGHTQGYLGGGEYAVVAGYGHPADESGALVELVGDPVELVPTADARIERDGDRVVVTTDRYGDDDHPPDATLTLTRVDTADERIIAEQVMDDGGLGSHGIGLRNALAALTADASRVVLRTDEHVADAAVGYDAQTRRFRFRGQAYEVSKHNEA